MVWNTTQSSLYKAVRDYNNEIDRQGCRSHKEDPLYSRSDENCASPKSEHRQASRCRKCANCPRYRTPPKGNAPGDLNIDSDFLLLAGLIFILYKNGADKKLIFALAIVLIG